MNGYLVVVRCGMDDLPCRLFADKGKAEAFAKEPIEAEVDRVAKLLNLDVTDLCNVSVATFADGVMTACDIVRDFEDEDDDTPI